jgi:hypothetical protein
MIFHNQYYKGIAIPNEMKNKSNLISERLGYIAAIAVTL